jgi:hypothetical protein
MTRKQIRNIVNHYRLSDFAMEFQRVMEGRPTRNPRFDDIIGRPGKGRRCLAALCEIDYGTGGPQYNRALAIANH